MMFHVGRSGSTIVADLLARTSGVVWDGELFERFARTGRAPSGVSTYARIDLLALVRDRLGTFGDAAYGIEVKFFHLREAGVHDLSAFLDGADALGFGAFVALERRNLLRKVISSAVAHATGTYHLARTAVPTFQRVALDPERVAIDGRVAPLVDHLEGYERDFEQLRAGLGPRRALWLTYEDDVAPDPRRAYERICAFVGLEPAQVTVRLRRTTPFATRHVLANFAEVREALSATRFAWMLDAP
jgi:hypothetical protein